jgi:hypothetical protein
MNGKNRTSERNSASKSDLSTGNATRRKSTRDDNVGDGNNASQINPNSMNTAATQVSTDVNDGARTVNNAHGNANSDNIDGNANARENAESSGSGVGDND